MNVHPVADLFPMLAGDDLAELAADIKARGLLFPIVLDGDGRVLDGRNRLAACEIAGVEPTFSTYGGDDPDGYALAVNGQRRDLTKSKRAMIAARAQSLVTKDWGGQARLARTLQVSETLVSQASVITQHADDLSDLVVAGAMSLDKAYDQARDRRREADETSVLMTSLEQEAPDLYDLVIEDPAHLEEARQSLERRRIERARARQESLSAWSAAVDGLTRALSYAKSYEPPDEMPDNYLSIEEFVQRAGDLLDIAKNWSSE